MKKRPLTFLFAGCLLSYHAYNLVQGAYWQAFQRRFFAVKQEGPSRVDKSALLLKGIGYLSRFAIGQEQEIAAMGPSSPYLFLYDRRDKPMFLALDEAGFQAEVTGPVTGIISKLESEGVKVAVLPLAPKQVIYRKELPKALPTESIYRVDPRPEKGDGHEYYQRFLTANAGHTVDLLAAYEALPALERQELYIPWDLHWASKGIAVAAIATLDHLRKQGVNVPEQSLVGGAQAEIDHTHRLLGLFQLPDWYLNSEKSFAWKERLYTLKAPPETRALASQGRLVLAGSSFCGRWKDTPYGLGKMLAKALQRELVDLCIEGGGQVGAFRKMEEEKISLRRGDIFVWEVMLPATFAPGEPKAPAVDPSS